MSLFENITVSILGKEYQVNCPKDDSGALRKAVEYLNKKMNETKKNSSAIGIDRIAIMTALNLADDLIKKDTLVSEITAEKNELSSQLNMQNTIIDSVSDKIETAIEEFEKKESSPK